MIFILGDKRTVPLSLYLKRPIRADLHAGRIAAAAVAFEHLAVRAESRDVKWACLAAHLAADADIPVD